MTYVIILDFGRFCPLPKSARFDNNFALKRPFINRQVGGASRYLDLRQRNNNFVVNKAHLKYLMDIISASQRPQCAQMFFVCQLGFQNNHTKASTESNAPKSGRSNAAETSASSPSRRQKVATPSGRLRNGADVFAPLNRRRER